MCIKLLPWLICSSSLGHDAPLFTLFRYPGNSLLSFTVTMETEVLEPGMCHHYDDCGTQTWQPSHDPSFIILFFSGSNVTELTLAYTDPTPLPLPDSSDWLQMDQSIIMFMINKTYFFTYPLIHLYHSISNALPIQFLKVLNPSSMTPLLLHFQLLA